MHNRENVKWAPFNSVINGDDVLNELEEEKKKVSKPTLSDDQIEELDTLIRETYADKSIIELIIYKNSRFYKIEGIITKIDITNKKVTINNKNSYYFANIIKIIRKNT